MVQVIQIARDSIHCAFLPAFPRGRLVAAVVPAFGTLSLCFNCFWILVHSFASKYSEKLAYTLNPVRRSLVEPLASFDSGFSSAV